LVLLNIGNKQGWNSQSTANKKICSIYKTSGITKLNDDCKLV